ncbi:disintegrin and metalloproteinase domain-containing protein 8 isoform X18 [Papio anubis]|uniref:disintegrin and metalloproteinase domain-containing protein 8 isoform X18 n=1 Tax=Papio anubis TaxID=9555 RepID=UPI0012AE812E|nr:disintegrin and metalloproteinase domain-containing protein 8 isoform X18 [Papio anubis]
MLFRQFPGQMGPAAPSPAASAAIVPSRPWARVERYEVVLPRRLPGPRVRRALPSHVGLYPERVSYVLGATGHNFTLHLRKNRDLLGSGYTETYTAANGSEVTEQPRGQDHCFYQGHVEGHPDSAASLSTCAGLRGFFQVGSDLHLIEPLDEGGEGGRHAVYQAEHLLQTAGTCGVSDDSLGSLLGPRTAAVFRPQPGGSLPSRETRYVELYVVADNAEFQMLGSEAAVRHRVLEVVNHVDKLYQKLNFRVVLVGLEIWNRQDRFYVSPDPNVTLENLLAWQARRLTQRHLQDNVQLITGVDFTGTTVGLARVSAMCSHSSGAVNQDCRNRCCNSTTCQLAEGAQCAHGTCCQECRVKPAGEPCRPKKDTCDLEEFCDGRHPECPEDAFQENGTPCFGGYCYNGTCPTLTQQCQAFWGPGGRAAEESCFSYDILPGCKTSWYRADMCGVLQCKGGQHPPGRTSCILNHVCHALTTEDGTAYELVPEGTRCGPEKGHWLRDASYPRFAGNNVARTYTFTDPETAPPSATATGYVWPLGTVPQPRGVCGLSGQCHNHGVCNHKQECHCHAGWAPPYCAKLLTEVHAASGSLPVIVAVVLVLLAVVVTLAGIIVYRKARSRILSRNATPKTTTGLSNPLFHQAASRMPAKQGAPAPTRGPQEQVPTTHAGQPARHLASSVALKRPPPAPPATVSRPPFPVPVYAQQAPKQVIKPTFAPPAPPVKPGAGATKPGPAESAVGPKVALKPPIQRKQGAGAPTAP